MDGPRKSISKNGSRWCGVDCSAAGSRSTAVHVNACLNACLNVLVCFQDTSDRAADEQNSVIGPLYRFIGHRGKAFPNFLIAAARNQEVHAGRRRGPRALADCASRNRNASLACRVQGVSIAVPDTREWDARVEAPAPRARESARVQVICDEASCRPQCLRREGAAKHRAGMACRSP